MAQDRRDLTIEIAVEQLDQCRRRYSVGKRSKPAHVGEPDRRPDGLGKTSPDLARQDARTGVLADIGVEQIDRGAAQRIAFGDAGQGRAECLECRAVAIGKAAGMAGRPGADMHLAIAELDRKGQVVGAAFGAQIVKLGKGARFGAIQPQPERPNLLVDGGDRAAAKRCAVEHLE
jgi:hypothetical protein